SSGRPLGQCSFTEPPSCHCDWKTLTKPHLVPPSHFITSRQRKSRPKLPPADRIFARPSSVRCPISSTPAPFDSSQLQL
ncbi:hypothetical protein PanWU01x14_312490, partial [Parasponia andersonii]